MLAMYGKWLVLLCLVVECSACPSPASSSCSSVTGCDQCPAGKRLPDCTQDCRHGTYGVNCANRCNCRHLDWYDHYCDIHDGSCKSGCPDWFVGKDCSTHIAYPDMSAESLTPIVYAYTHKSVNIGWYMLSDLEHPQFYSYNIEYQKAGEEDFRTFITVDHVDGPFEQHTVIDQLYPNTEYSFRIVPCRNITTDDYNNQNDENGTSTQSVIQKTEKNPFTMVFITLGVCGGVAICVAIGVLVGCRIRKWRLEKNFASLDDVLAQAMPVAVDEDNLGFQNPHFEEESVQTIRDWPTYENMVPSVLAPTPTCIAVQSLAAYVQNKKKERKGFEQEFNKLMKPNEDLCTVARKEDNKKKNRYINVFAYDHSRVVLSTEAGDESSDYINANFIPDYEQRPQAYVATQGPTAETINDMWRLIWEVDIRTVVMLTKLRETEITEDKKIKAKIKCDLYWPATVGETSTYGQISVIMTDEDKYADYTVRTFMISKKRSGMHQAKQFHFTAWPDQHRLPHAFPLLSFRRRVRCHQDESNGHLLVHCSAGIGRTGTYLALDYLLQQAEAEKQVDVFSYVNLMRHKRMHMVQNSEQYTFIYDALVEGLAAGQTAVPKTEFIAAYEELSKTKSDEDSSMLEQQYQLLTEFSNSLQRKASKKDGMDKETLLNGYKFKRRILIMPAPKPDTVSDIWTVLKTHNANCVAMLNEMDENTGIYWPSKIGSSLTFDHVIVTLTSTKSIHNHVLERDITVTHKSDKTEISFRQFVLNHDVPCTGLPDPEVMCNLVRHLLEWQNTHGENYRMVIHCKDGMERSALLYSCMYVIEKLCAEQEVDIFTSAKHVKTMNKDFISSMAEYQFLFEVVRHYLTDDIIYEDVD